VLYTPRSDVITWQRNVLQSDQMELRCVMQTCHHPSQLRWVFTM